MIVGSVVTVTALVLYLLDWKWAMKPLGRWIMSKELTALKDQTRTLSRTNREIKQELLESRVRVHSLESKLQQETLSVKSYR